jgi:hypothetical protein
MIMTDVISWIGGVYLNIFYCYTWTQKYYLLTFSVEDVGVEDGIDVGVSIFNLYKSWNRCWCWRWNICLIRSWVGIDVDAEDRKLVE